MDDLKIGVVGLPGKWSTETLADAVAKKTGFRLIIDMSEVTLNLTTRELLFRGHDLCSFDALIIKKISQQYSPNTLDRLELLRVAESAGVAVFSRPEHILRLVDRLSCTVTLNNAGLPMPPTCITEDVEEAVSIVQDYGATIFKPLYSTKARGMCVISHSRNIDKIRKSIMDFKAANPMMYIQKKMDLGGTDMGLVFMAGDYLGAYARVSKKDTWNTTINSGGCYQPVQPSQQSIDLANKAQNLFDMTYTTVDIAETEQGAVVFEVSAFGGFRGAKEGMGLNVAELYADHVFNSVNT